MPFSARPQYRLTSSFVTMLYVLALVFAWLSVSLAEGPQLPGASAHKSAVSYCGEWVNACETANELLAGAVEITDLYDLDDQSALMPSAGRMSSLPLPLHTGDLSGSRDQPRRVPGRVPIVG